MGVETENDEVAAKGFENTDFMGCISRRLDHQNLKVVPFLFKKGRYKSGPH